MRQVARPRWPDRSATAARLARLRERLSSPTSAHRSLALAALSGVIAYPPDLATAAEAWRLLCERTDDIEPTTAAAARETATKALRGAVRTGVGEAALAALAGRVDRFDDAERLRLLDALENVRAYDLREGAALLPHVERLEARLRPKAFPQRLRLAVGFWGPASLRDDARDRDLALARDGLSGDAPLLHEVDWLVSDAARRAVPFTHALVPGARPSGRLAGGGRVPGAERRGRAAPPRGVTLPADLAPRAGRGGDGLGGGRRPPRAPGRAAPPGDGRRARSDGAGADSALRAAQRRRPNRPRTPPQHRPPGRELRRARRAAARARPPVALRYRPGRP